MTEYDYSPDAYDRYLANQNRVSSWVNKQAGHTREYTSPFVDTSVAGGEDYSSHSGSGYRDRAGGSSRHGSRSPPTSRPPPKRSYTTPAPMVSPSGTTYQQPQQRALSPSSRYQAPHHQSYSTHNVYQQYPQPQYPAPQVAYIASRAGHSGQSGHSRHHKSSSAYPTTTKTYAMDGVTGELHLPPPRRGEQYIIIPPKGRTVEVFHERADGSRSSATSRSSSRSPRSPTRKDEPLLKRLFNLGGGAQHRPKSGGGSTRRQRRLSY